MPDRSLRVLIVEDREEVSDLIERLLSALRPGFPLLTFIKVATLSEALVFVHADPPPDLVTLDLRLKDAGPSETLSHVREIEERCPCVIVTGRMIEERFDEMLRELRVEVVAKGPSWMADNGFLDAAARAIVRGAERIRSGEDPDKMKARVNKLRELTRKMYPPEDNAS